jgi:hypothetical protein
MVERVLVDILVRNQWRLGRMRGVESALSGQADSAQALRRLQRIVNSSERNYHRARKQLALQAARARAERAQQPKDSKATSKSSGLIRKQPEREKVTPFDPSFQSLRWIC